MDTYLQMKVECPRCHRIITAQAGEDHAECNCHLYCSSGNDPADCSVTWQEFQGQLSWPLGIHNNPPNEGEYVLERRYYCSTHDLYYYKEKILIPCNWHRWRSRKRAPKKMRFSLGEY